MNITGHRLRGLREERGMSQEAVARALGISRTAYNKYESGAIRPVRKLAELSELFGVSADYILGQESELMSLAADAAPKARSQVKKYLRLSPEGQGIVDITLDAVHDRENPPTGES